MADKNNKINDEKSLIELIRKVFQKEVLDLSKSAEFTENQLEEKLNNDKSKMEH